MINTYISLHNHTDYSNLRLIDSINKPNELIDYAYELGLKGIAITDHESLSSHVKALDYWQNKYADKDFKVILGNEIYLARKDLTAETYQRREPFYHFILLAKDKEGYKQLRALSSRAWSRGFVKVMMRVFNTTSDLCEIIKGGHVIGSTACIGSYTGKKFLDGDYEDVKKFINVMGQLFGEGNFYVELQPSHQPDQIAYNKFLIENFWGKYPFIFTTDSHYLKKEDRELHKAFLRSKNGEREVDTFYSATYLMSFDEVASYFKDYISMDKIEEMARNTLSIGDKIETFSLKQPQIVTKVKHENIADNRAYFDAYVNYEKYPYFKYYRFTDNDSDSYFFKEVSNGFVKENVAKEKVIKYIDEIEIELRAIKEISDKMGVPLSDYFTSMAKMIDIIWNEGDSIVGPSRGSAGAFLINYLLGITQMNPMEQPLRMASWRFLDPERPELPDIDFDTESFKRQRVFNKLQEYFRSIGGDVYNICTFGTEGTKSALKTAARGLDISDEVVSYLGSMVPNERGFDWTLDQCYYGDEDHPAIKAFKEEIDQYPELWALAHKIEGLITRIGVHASGIVCVNGDFLDYNSVMKTPKGQLVSAYELHDSEACGLVKYDALTVSALDRVRQCFNYLLENHEIVWQGNLKATYDKYLNPRVLNYDDAKMWDMVDNGEITALFQFDTAVGSQAIKEIKPRSLAELAVSNAVMRLQCEGELPLDTYVRFKNDIHQWYSEMNMYGLTEDETKILEHYLLPYYGVAATQEVVMELAMEPKIANFTMAEANKLRKTIAKKQFDKIEEVHQLFLKKGREAGNSDNILNYVWNVQVQKSLGYSFSIVHTTGYSILAIQEMNLARFYPILYWNCACLSVDSSAIDEADFDNLLDEGIIDLSDDEDKRDINKTDVNKIITAVNRFKHSCTITSPDINKSKLGFMPDVENNRIIYGLKGITRITSPVIQEIVSHRPYLNLEDFMQRINKRIVSRDKIVYLIKAGCFNDIEKKTTREILKSYILATCDQKQRITLQNANMLIEKELLPDELKDDIKIFKATKELKRFADKEKGIYLVPDSMDKNFLESLLEPNLMRLDSGRIVETYSITEWEDKVAKPMKARIKKYLDSHKTELLDILNNALFTDDWNKYAAGDELQWELDSLNYYKTESPLLNIIQQVQNDVPLSNLSEIQEGKIDGFFTIKEKRIPKLHLYSFIATVLNRNTTKGIVTVQAPDGVITLKLYKDLFAFYDNATETPSFFEKGTHLLVTGIMRGSVFVPKVYKKTGRQSLVKLLIDNGQLIGYQNKDDDDDEED